MLIHQRAKSRAFTGRGVVAVAAVMLLATACSSGSKSNSAGTPAPSGPPSTAGAAAPASQSAAAPSGDIASSIKGKRFTLMIQSSPNTNKVVETHAVGILKAEGVNASVKWNASSTNIAVTQLLSGDIDAWAAGPSGGVGAAAAGVAIKDFALLQPRQDYVMLAKKGINTIQDLKGKKIGVQDTTGNNYVQALLVLQQANLTVKDVTIVQSGAQSVRLAALVAGRVDSTMLSHSAQIKLGPQGYVTVFDFTKQASNLYDDNAFATTAWLAKNGDVATAFNEAILQSFQWFDDPANADAVVKEALAVQPGSDEASTAQLFDVLRKADLYPVGTVLDESALKSQEDLFVSTGALKNGIPTSQWVDTSFAQKAKAAMPPSSAASS
ncbi:MAG: ABC transporter substrate-binding protein [Acidothermaceae bacterium]